MRAINPATGSPYPRRRPVDWGRTRDILRYRQESARHKRDGFTLVSGFSNHPWDSPDISHIIVDTRIGHGGRSLWVKLERRNPANG